MKIFSLEEQLKSLSLKDIAYIAKETDKFLEILRTRRSLYTEDLTEKEEVYCLCLLYAGKIKIEEREFAGFLEGRHKKCVIYLKEK